MNNLIMYVTKCRKMCQKQFIIFGMHKNKRRKAQKTFFLPTVVTAHPKGINGCVTKSRAKNKDSTNHTNNKHTNNRSQTLQNKLWRIVSWYFRFFEKKIMAQFALQAEVFFL